MAKKRIVEDKLGMDSEDEILPVESDNQYITTNNLNLIDDYNIARESVRTILETNTDIIRLLKTELELEPTNIKLAKVISELMTNLNESTNNLVELSKKMAEIYRLGKEQDKEFANNNVIFKDAILVGNLNDILKR